MIIVVKNDIIVVNINFFLALGFLEHQDHFQSLHFLVFLPQSEAIRRESATTKSRKLQQKLAITTPALTLLKFHKNPLDEEKEQVYYVHHFLAYHHQEFLYFSFLNSLLFDKYP